VLPGAYSLFKFEAISGAPMDAFLDLQIRKDENRIETITCGMANAYLAEDRIMCM